MQAPQGKRNLPLGKRLYAYRNRKRLTRLHVAKALDDISDKTVQRMENEGSVPTEKQREVLIRLLGIPVDLYQETYEKESNWSSTVSKQMRSRQNKSNAEKFIDLEPTGVFDEDALVDEFITALRAKRYEGRAFSHPFYRDLMQQTRGRLQPTDVDNLLQCIMDSSKSPELRSRCASLIFCPRTFPARLRLKRQQVIDVLKTYSSLNISNKKVLPSEVLRAIAFALANQINEDDLLLSYITWVVKSGYIERSLVETEDYYLGPSEALDYFISRLGDLSVPERGCVWEAFYVAHRASPADQGFLKRIMDHRRLRTEAGSRQRSFWEGVCRKMQNPEVEFGFP